MTEVMERVKAVGVTILPDDGGMHDEYTPVPPLHSNVHDHAWTVEDRYNILDFAQATWSLTGKSGESLEQAIDIIKEVAIGVQSAAYVGFLSLEDRSRFGIIVGQKGATVQRLQDETGCMIRVPHGGDYTTPITVTGAYHWVYSMLR